MIKNIDERIIAEGFHTGHEVDVVTIQKSDYEHLKEQAERVQELEEERDEWKYTAQSYYMTNQELREQNKRYREVINKFFELEGSYKDIVNRAERMFIKVLDEIGG